MRPITILFIVIVVLAAGVGTWFYVSNGETTPTPATNDTTLNGTDPVARVNGQTITHAEVERVALQIAAAQGVSDLSQLPAPVLEQLQTQAIDAAIARELVLDAAAAGGVTASAAEVDAQLNTTKGQFPSDADYQAALAQQGLTEADLRKQVETNIITQTYLDQTLDLDSLAATDAEIQTEYDTAVAGAAEGTEIPELADIRDQIESYVLQQKKQDLINAHTAELRTNADVEILI